MTTRSATRSTRSTTAFASCGSNARTDSRSHFRHDHQGAVPPSGDTPGPARSRNVGQIPPSGPTVMVSSGPTPAHAGTAVVTVGDVRRLWWGCSGGGSLLRGAGGSQAVGVGAGGDDVGAEGEPVDHGGGEAGVGEGAAPFGERGVARAGDGGFLLAGGVIWNSSSAP